jgi:glycosyltransferase involved in cell wall biosynthesis
MHQARFTLIFGAKNSSMIFRMEAPSYSVVIPTMGRETLFRAVQSASIQTFKPLEILVVAHNGSLSAQAINVLRSIPDVRIINVQPGNAGVTRNIGILESKGSYIAFLDDDDIWLERKMELQLNNRDFAVVSCRAEYKGFLNTIKPKILYAGDFLNSIYPTFGIGSRKVVLPTPTLVVESNLAKSVLFDETLAEREDLWFIHEIEKKHARFIQLSEVLVTVNSRMPLSDRDVSVSSDIDWFKRLETVELGLGWRFLIGVALRNRMARMDLSGFFKLISRAIHSS